MNTLADTPLPGLVPDPAVQPAAAVSAVTALATETVSKLPVWSFNRAKDLLVTIYAYGLLAFGILFPLLLAAWKLFLSPDA